MLAFVLVLVTCVWAQWSPLATRALCTVSPFVPLADRACSCHYISCDPSGNCACGWDEATNTCRPGFQTSCNACSTMQRCGTDQPLLLYANRMPIEGQPVGWGVNPHRPDDGDDHGIHSMPPTLDTTQDDWHPLVLGAQDAWQGQATMSLGGGMQAWQGQQPMTGGVNDWQGQGMIGGAYDWQGQGMIGGAYKRQGQGMIGGGTHDNWQGQGMIGGGTHDNWQGQGMIGGGTHDDWQSQGMIGGGTHDNWQAQPGMPFAGTSDGSMGNFVQFPPLVTEALCTVSPLVPEQDRACACHYISCESDGECYCGWDEATNTCQPGIPTSCAVCPAMRRCGGQSPVLYPDQAPFVVMNPSATSMSTGDQGASTFQPVAGGGATEGKGKPKGAKAKKAKAPKAKGGKKATPKAKGKKGTMNEENV